MICENCMAGGNLNSLLKTGTVPITIIDEMVKRMNLIHMACKGGTWCDCQHKAGVWLEQKPSVLGS